MTLVLSVHNYILPFIIHALINCISPKSQSDKQIFMGNFVWKDACWEIVGKNVIICDNWQTLATQVSAFGTKKYNGI